MEKDIPVDQIQTILTNIDIGIEDDDDDDDAKSDSTFEFIKKQIKEFYLDNIPVEIVKHLPIFGTDSDLFIV
jgi:hypothetical protein